MEEKITEAANVILNSKYVVALTGAGFSTESGIPDFRGPEGVWTRFGEPSFTQYGDFLADPSAWMSMLQEGPIAELIGKLVSAEPNPGHHALAELEQMGILKCVITQNIDNLHQKAGSKKVIEFHGNVYKSRCINCGKRYGLEMIGGRCECGGLIKTDTVLFGEPIPKDSLELAFEEARKCDCMIVAGTSAVVYPAAALPEIAKTKRDYSGLRFRLPLPKEEKGARIIEINNEETSLTHSVSDYFIEGKTGEILPLLVTEIKSLLPEKRK